MEREVQTCARVALAHMNLTQGRWRAAAHARRFLELWDGCAPDLQSIYQEGEALLARRRGPAGVGFRRPPASQVGRARAHGERSRKAT